MDINLYILFPYEWFSWLGIALLGSLLLYAIVIKSRPVFVLKGRDVYIFLGFFLVQLLFSRILLISLPNEGLFPVPGMPVEPLKPVLALFMAVPWVIAAGYYGLFWSVLLAIFGGLAVSLSTTHNLFTVFEYGGLALLFNLAIRQNYRWGYYKLFRHPFGAAFTLALLYIPVYVTSAFFSTPGPLEARIDYALTQYWMTILARTIELLLAGLAAELLYQVRSAYWRRPSNLVPSPEESSLRIRILFGTIPLVIILILTLTVGDWLVAGNAARQMVKERLETTAQSAADSLPDFFAAGQGLVRTLATQDILLGNRNQVEKVLEQKVSALPLFSQMVAVDERSNIVGSYPKSIEPQLLAEEEKSALALAVKGVIGQYRLIPAATGQNSYRVTFIAPVLDPNNPQALPKGALLGRAPLANVFTNPTINAIDGLKDWNGDGQFIDEKHIIIFHPNPTVVGTPYVGRLPEKVEFFDEVSSNGSRRLVYYQPMKGHPWAVVLAVPAERIQRLSLDIAFPLLSILTVFSVLTLIFLAVSLRKVTRSLRTLSTEATMISRGQLDIPLAHDGEDEVGQLGRAFEQMRQSLKARLDDLNRLLRVSQAVASSLNIENAIPPILDAALQDSVSCARIILFKDSANNLESERIVSRGRGSKSELYAYLDSQLIDMVRVQPVITIPNMNRVRRLTIPAGQPQPGAIIAMTLKQENRFFGVIWIAYDQPHTFTEEEVNFLGTLSGQAALAASNAQLYDSAEVGRQYLSAILASSPEPVLVIDDKLRLAIINPAAHDTPGLVIGGEKGRPVREIVANLDLLDLITQPLEDQLASKEISLPGGRIFFASVSPVVVNKKVVGRICLLQNITQYKELDKLKSEFVSTVSHDLRSPLTLMRGYAAMMNMVGELNDQQKSFQRKIITGVENMTRLVNNLLDLGRLDAGFPLQRERLIVQEVISQVLASLQPNAIQKNIQVEHQGAILPPVYLEADRALLQQAISNLVDNAIKYTPVNGHVHVGIIQKPSSIMVTVRDTGIGIAPLDLPHVFEKFYRSGRREQNQQKSGGLGLAIVKSIAEHHGGTVHVDSQLGKGSVFALEIPLNGANHD